MNIIIATVCWRKDGNWTRIQYITVMTAGQDIQVDIHYVILVIAQRSRSVAVCFLVPVAVLLFVNVSLFAYSFPWLFFFMADDVL